MSFLSGKKILLIAPIFYDYHTQIIHSLELQGAAVTFYPEMEHSLLYRIACKLSNNLKKKLETIHVERLIANMNDVYDIVFVVRGAYFTPESLLCMRSKSPKARFVLYQWDSVLQNNYLPLINHFDSVQTFDMMDAEKYNLTYLPLFYTSRYKQVAKSDEKKDYHLVFYGAYHSDRLEVVKRVSLECKKYRLKFLSHLYVSKLALFRLLIVGVLRFSDLKFLKTYKVSVNDIVHSYCKSEAVLDIELDIQNGLTMRTFEVLGSNLKLITTNINIKNESFYHPEKIMVVDRHNIQLETSFFQEKNVWDENFKKFYVDAWLEKCLHEI